MLSLIHILIKTSRNRILLQLMERNDRWIVMVTVSVDCTWLRSISCGDRPPCMQNIVPSMSAAGTFYRAIDKQPINTE